MNVKQKNIPVRVTALFNNVYSFYNIRSKYIFLETIVNQPEIARKCFLSTVKF